MSPTRKKVRIGQTDAVSIIKKHLGKKAKGRKIIAAYEKDPENNGEVLINYIREEMPKDSYDALVDEIVQASDGKTSQAQINNIITGGKIDQLINISRLDNLTIEKKISPFRDVKQLLVFLFIFLLVVGVIYGVYWYSIQPRKLNGDFNIAIAQLGEITNEGIKPTALSTKIGNSLLNYLDTEFKTSKFALAVDVSNQNMPLITEDHDAKKLADRVRATIVIYGNIYVQGGEAKLSPRFYVSEDFDASELTGESELAKPIILNIATIDDQEKIEQDFKARAAILANFTYSLIYLSEENFDDASARVQKAINIAETSNESFSGKENLYLLNAHIETALKNYKVANEMLDLALDINSNYARAYIARGNIYYAQAIQSKPYNNDFLEKALTEYKRAQQAHDQPPGANIPIKANMSIGNIYFLKARNANNSRLLYLTAIKSYQFVTDQYEQKKDPSIKELAALNYFNIGIAYERAGELLNAIKFYEKSKRTTSDPKFKEKVENQLYVAYKSLDHLMYLMIFKGGQNAESNFWDIVDYVVVKLKLWAAWISKYNYTN